MLSLSFIEPAGNELFSFRKTLMPFQRGVSVFNLTVGQIFSYLLTFLQPVL